MGLLGMSEYDKPAVIDADVVKNLGPLVALVGTWEGIAGIDLAPSPKGPVQTPFRERRTYEPFGPVINGSQVLYGLRYASVMWPDQSIDPFHEETGYWLWDPKAEQVMCCFVVPRGVVVNAGATVAPDAKKYTLAADVGSSVYGVMSNPFLDAVYRTVRFEMTVTYNDDGSFTYQQNTQLQMQHSPVPFDHTDSNTLKKVL
jgi:hypothetical protein